MNTTATPDSIKVSILNHLTDQQKQHLRFIQPVAGKDLVKIVPLGHSDTTNCKLTMLRGTAIPLHRNKVAKSITNLSDPTVHATVEVVIELQGSFQVIELGPNQEVTIPAECIHALICGDKTATSTVLFISKAVAPTKTDQPTWEETKDELIQNRHLQDAH